MSKAETETTESSEKKLQLDSYTLRKIKDSAMQNYISAAPSPRMDADAFTAYIWTKAVVDYLIKEGYDIPKVEQGGKR